MKRFFQTLWLGVLVAVLSSVFLMPRADASEHPDKIKTISEYSYLWGDPSEGLESVRASSPERWKTVKSGEALPKKPKGITTAWIKIQLPSHIPKDYGVYIKAIYTQHISVYLGQKLVQEFKFDFSYDQQSSLFHVSSEDGGESVFIRVETTMGRLGILSDIKLDNFAELLRSYVLWDLENIILGSAFIFFGVIMLMSAIFLKRAQLSDWLLVSVILLSLGTIFITYSPFTYANFTKYGEISTMLFDISLMIFLPALTFYFKRLFTHKKLILICWFKKFQVIYSLFVITFLIVNVLSHYKFNNAYFFVAVTALGYLMIFQFALIMISSLILAVKGNKEAIIFSVGFASLACLCIIDLIDYYVSSQYKQIFLWKWGILGFILSLIVIIGRRFSINQEKLLLYNHQLQLSEKMEIISSLAASIAHEVRNPLQVTRGFLQLMASRSDEKSQDYMKIAIEELDRASLIISDFLTFSKPQLEDVVELNIFKELSQIEGIVVPLATLHGGEITIDIPDDLVIQGNSSKLKQVLINLIKNSIEAFRSNGLISIWAYAKDGDVFIHIKDNGEGIDDSKIARLGEPYYTTKVKGTGLGLMVSFRIVETMKGRIEFKSQRDAGTEVILRFPSIVK